MNKFDIEIPPYFFELSPIKILWIDLMENWIYLELEIECPMCFRKQQYLIISLVNELDILKNYKCTNCGYGIGDLLYAYIKKEIDYITMSLK